jgi:tetratricopeptide (TPR) repeat protein
MAKHDYPHAVADCDIAIQLNPQDPLAYYNRGTAYSLNDDQDHAIADLSQAIQLSPGFARAYYNRAVAYKYKGDKAAAIADYQKVLTMIQDPQERQKIEDKIKELGGN